jgi:hypothetical protein
MVFSYGVYQRVFVPPFPVSVNDLKQRITAAAAVVCSEQIGYRIVICHVTRGSHLELL